jgi:integrase
VDIKALACVLSTLGSPDAQRCYRFAIEDFIGWYCSEPRLGFNRAAVLGYRLELESRHLASSSINLRLAYEAADTGLLSPESAASIRRVKGARQLGVRLGNWLTADEAKALLDAPDVGTIRSKRSRAILALCLTCGLRRSELAHLTMEHLQKREGHWAMVDLVGKAGHIRTVPVPDWVKAAVADWTVAARVSSGRIFRCVNKSG